NTGWVGGPYGVGKRIDIDYTRAMVRAAIDGSIESSGFHEDPVFQLLIPEKVTNVPTEVLTPRNLWADKENYDQQAARLRKRFDEVMGKFLPLPE
ncbi:MAG: phosphoenolpyruvate carboxykinase (ATP), partial [Candidatus Atribacteria bacterium]|nr:phosphoenolpyruvate carboxykinase (ATP) [Candidatus Atribacteria bacterium]